MNTNNGWLLFLAMLGVLASWLILEWFPVERDVVIRSSDIQHFRGRAYVAPIRLGAIKFLLSGAGDSEDAPKKSRAQLFEDGRPLGPPHANYVRIQDVGGGAYSHWRGALVFSSSDGTDPLKNGREYRIHLELSPNTAFRAFGLAAAGSLLWLAFRSLPAPGRGRIVGVVRPAYRELAYPSARFGSWIAWAVLGALCIAAGWRYLWGIWTAGQTLSFGVAGFFQMSDASGYAYCANRMLDGFAAPVAEYGGGWCVRRPVYESFLATLFGMSGRWWLGSLLTQAAMVSLAIVTAARAAARVGGWAAGLAVGAILYAFASEHAYPTTATENAGLAFGAIGAAFLMDGARQGSRLLLLWGAACLSVALNARAGAFFVLPLFVVFSWYQAEGNLSKRLVAAGAMAAACATGFVVQAVLAWGFGGEPGASHGNFAYTLYGLSAGGKGWSYVQSAHPELFQAGLGDAGIARKIYELAWRNIAADPLTLAAGLWRGTRVFLTDPSYGFPGAAPLSVPGLLWWLGAVAIAVNWRQPGYRLIGVAFLGVILSAPLIVLDGGTRVFAATWPFNALQQGLGAAFLLRGTGRIAGMREWATPKATPEHSPIELGFSVLLMAAVLLPLTPFTGIVSAPLVSGAGCPAGQEELVARVGRESYLITTLPPESDADPWKMQVRQDDLLAGLGGTWFEEEFARLSPPVTLLHGYQVATGAGSFGRGADVRVLVHGNLAPVIGERVSLCLDPKDTVPLAEGGYHVARSVRVLSDGSARR